VCGLCGREDTYQRYAIDYNISDGTRSLEWRRFQYYFQLRRLYCNIIAGDFDSDRQSSTVVCLDPVRLLSGPTAVYYTPPTPTLLNCRVELRRRCVLNSQLVGDSLDESEQFADNEVELRRVGGV